METPLGRHELIGRWTVFAIALAVAATLTAGQPPAPGQDQVLSGETTVNLVEVEAGRGELTVAVEDLLSGRTSILRPVLER